MKIHVEWYHDADKAFPGSSSKPVNWDKDFEVVLSKDGYDVGYRRTCRGSTIAEIYKESELVYSIGLGSMFGKMFEEDAEEILNDFLAGR